MWGNKLTHTRVGTKHGPPQSGPPFGPLLDPLLDPLFTPKISFSEHTVGRTLTVAPSLGSSYCPSICVNFLLTRSNEIRGSRELHDNKHLMTGPKGNSELFFFPETLNASRGEAEGNIEVKEVEVAPLPMRYSLGSSLKFNKSLKPPSTTPDPPTSKIDHSNFCPGFLKKWLGTWRVT